MNFDLKTLGKGVAFAALFAAAPLFAQEAAAVADAAATAAPAVADAAAAAAPAAPVADKGDTAWMLAATVLVFLMTIPGLALFYGGLVRSKNMLSVLTQVFMICAIVCLLWVCYGYSLAFTSGNEIIGSLDKVFLKGVNTSSMAATFSNGVYIPEYVFIAFQMTFACITPGLIVGAFAERVKFGALMIFVVAWSTLVYFPMAHMVWYWAGPDFLKDAPTDYGYLWGKGALDFAGGTVVHINAGIAGLVGALILGKRTGFGKEPMPPHSLVMTMIGASLLWVGWFGFNAGSNLEANGLTALAMMNTFTATAAAAVAWMLVEQVAHGKPSMLGGVTGAVAGLVAITPASGYATPITSIVLGIVATIVCYVFCTTIKNKLKYDDSLDVFGVHCVGGIIGALGTAIVADPALGGQGFLDYTVIPAVAGAYDMGAQMLTQGRAVLVTLIWSGGISAVLFFVLEKTLGLRPTVEVEREGLDISELGERAYNL
ncbi:MAG: ammonia channel protein [Alphaproteobacteria bacterium PA4]|nr:MAG: ammonia channel protein [Alphaproteobacteria bacterium PA4]